ITSSPAPAPTRPPRSVKHCVRGHLDVTGIPGGRSAHAHRTYCSRLPEPRRDSFPSRNHVAALASVPKGNRSLPGLAVRVRSARSEGGADHRGRCARRPHRCTRCFPNATGVRTRQTFELNSSRPRKRSARGMRTVFDLPESATRQVGAAAGMAPSLFNTQPWRFRLCPDRIEVHADLGRRLIAHDPEDRELRIACGAALFNLRLAVHAHGITPVVTIEP